MTDHARRSLNRVGVPAGTATQAMVGRLRELERLRQLAGQAVSGRGAAAVLVGEPGIGKTSLLREM